MLDQKAYSHYITTSRRFTARTLKIAKAHVEPGLSKARQLFRLPPHRPSPTDRSARLPTYSLAAHLSPRRHPAYTLAALSDLDHLLSEQSHSRMHWTDQVPDPWPQRL